jgi:hypothetical protein
MYGTPDDFLDSMAMAYITIHYRGANENIKTDWTRRIPTTDLGRL